MPLTVAVPPVGCSRSATIRMSVVLPQPDGPISETNSPAPTFRLMSVSAWTGASAVWKVRLRSRISMTVSPATEAPKSDPAVEMPASRASPSDGIRAFHYGTEQHVATSGAVALGGVLDLVMADPVLAGDEDHGGGGHPAQIAGIVAGT